MMENGQLLWGLNSVLIIALGFFVRIWMVRLASDIAKIEAKIDIKVDATLCTERMGSIKEIDRSICERNEKEHGEIFERLRKIESIK